jgi:hypothetical protein
VTETTGIGTTGTTGTTEITGITGIGTTEITGITGITEITEITEVETATEKGIIGITETTGTEIIEIIEIEITGTTGTTKTTGTPEVKVIDATEERTKVKQKDVSELNVTANNVSDVGNSSRKTTISNSRMNTIKHIQTGSSSKATPCRTTSKWSRSF